MSTVIYGIIVVCILVGAVLAMLAFTKPGSFLASWLKPVSDRIQKKLERGLAEDQLKLANAREAMEVAREKANVAFLSAEKAERRLRVVQSPAYRENVKLKMLRELEEKNEKLRQRIAELKKRQEPN